MNPDLESQGLREGNLLHVLMARVYMSRLRFETEPPLSGSAQVPTSACAASVLLSNLLVKHLRGLKKCQENTPLDNIVEANFTYESRGSL